MFYDYYLKFTDEAQAHSVLYSREGVELDMDGNVTNEGYDKPNYDCIDIIGVIYKATDVLDAEGNPVMEALDGWHVNVRNYTEATELDAYAVFPTQPRRIWMGS